MATPPTAASSRERTAPTTYNAALRWLHGHMDFERMRSIRYNASTFDLQRTRRLLEALGAPDRHLRCVHIAGTKGKGSTAAMLSSMLRACGHRVGLFTSPHLLDVRERIQVDETMVRQTDLTALLRQIHEITAGHEQTPTFFEILTACALRHFADRAVDVAILETGMGGRLDSTNVVTPEVCGITQISHDHTHVLGTELTSIAREKGGILKRGVPAVTIEQTPEVMGTLKAVAQEVGTTLEVAEEDLELSYRFEATREFGPHMRVCVSRGDRRHEHLRVPLKGEHQAHNCGLALALLDHLQERGLDVPEEKVIDGLARTQLAGRMEMVWHQPRILLDGAHNGASLQALIRTIGAYIPYDSLVVIFGCAPDKDIRSMLEQISLGADKAIFVRSNPRAVPPEELLSKFQEMTGKMAQTAESVAEALHLAARAVGRGDLVCVTGSFRVVGEAKRYLAERAAVAGRERARK